MIITLAIGLAGCGASAAHFTTELGAAGGLAKGDPVMHAGAQIGQVSGVSRSSYGSSEVGFDVERPSASLVHQDSIAVLHSGPETPSLELRNPSPASPVAAPGSRITGASSETEVNAILASRGLGNYVMGLAQILAALSAAPASGANPAAVASLTRQLLEIQRRAALGAYASAATAQHELRHLARQLEAARRELERQGKTAEAQRLQDEIKRLLRATTPSAAPSTHSTLVAPRVYP